MKKLFLALCLALTATAFGQYIPSPYPYNGYTTQIYPVYYPLITAGNFLTYSYDSIPTPSSDTIRVQLNGATEAYHYVLVTHNIILLFDTTGDTLLYATKWSNKHWYKKTPFAGTLTPAHQLDKLHYIFQGGSTSSNYTITVPWFNAGLAGDTIHVPKKTTTGGGSNIDAYFLNQKGGIIWNPYTTW